MNLSKLNEYHLIGSYNLQNDMTIFICPDLTKNHQLLTKSVTSSINNDNNDNTTNNNNNNYNKRTYNNIEFVKKSLELNTNALTIENQIKNKKLKINNENDESIFSTNNEYTNNIEDNNYNNSREILMERKNLYICIYDLYCHYNIISNPKKTSVVMHCFQFPNCLHIHYDCGPMNQGCGWKSLSKEEVLTKLPLTLYDTRILNAINNDNTLLLHSKFNTMNNTHINKSNINNSQLYNSQFREICLIDLRYHYNLLNNNGRCHRYPFCSYIHYDVGPQNGTGWQNMTKAEICSRLPPFSNDRSILRAIENDETLQN